jgi:hypothetical protein
MLTLLGSQLKYGRSHYFCLALDALATPVKVQIIQIFSHFEHRLRKERDPACDGKNLKLTDPVDFAWPYDSDTET